MQLIDQWEARKTIMKQSEKLLVSDLISFTYNTLWDRSVTPWLVVYGHRPMYCTNDDRDDCTKFETRTRTGLPLLKIWGLEVYSFGNQKLSMQKTLPSNIFWTFGWLSFFKLLTQCFTRFHNIRYNQGEYTGGQSPYYYFIPTKDDICFILLVVAWYALLWLAVAD